MRFKFKTWAVALAAIFLWPSALISAAEPTAEPADAHTQAYEVFSAARKATHSAGQFRLRGEETVAFNDTVGGKKTSAVKSYAVSGYDFGAAETHIQFAPQGKDAETAPVNSFLITASKIYAKEGAGKWNGQDILTLLPKFLSLGTLDQFFMLELMNSDRLSVYKNFMWLEAGKTEDGITYDIVRLKITKVQFGELAGLLTADVKALLGKAAEGMSEDQLAMVQKFAKSMLAGIDAEMTFSAYIEAESGRVTRFTTQMDMANPYGRLEPGAVSRINTNSRLTFYDFGMTITKVVVE